MTSYKKFLVALSALVVVGAALYALSFLIAQPGTPTPDPEPEPSSEQTTLQGEIACLPHRGDGPHTLECAIGLKADDGKHYALKNLSDPAIPVQTKVEVTGELTEETSDVYDTAGTVDIETIEKL